jgi:hypothetical protein
VDMDCCLHVHGTAHPTLYRRHSLPYPISQTWLILPDITDTVTLPYIMEQTALPNIKDTVHSTLYHIHGKPYPLSWDSPRSPISQIRSTLPYITNTVHPTLYRGTVRAPLYQRQFSPTGLCFHPQAGRRRCLPNFGETVHIQARSVP